MTGVTTTITIDDAQAREKLKRLGDTSGLMPIIGEYVQGSTQKRFADQRTPDGTPWKDLNRSYASRKKYNKDKVLTLRGYLRRSIRYQVTSGTAVEVGTNLKYAAIHQFGGVVTQAAQSRKVRYRSVAGRVLFAGKRHKQVTERWVSRNAQQGKIDARPFLGISAEDQTQIAQRITDWVNDQTGT